MPQQGMGMAQQGFGQTAMAQGMSQPGMMGQGMMQKPGFPQQQGFQQGMGQGMPQQGMGMAQQGYGQPGYIGSQQQMSQQGMGMAQQGYGQQQAWRPQWMQSYTPNTSGDYMEWFRLADTNRNGSISAPELRIALKAAGQNVDETAADLMIRMYDKDQSGAIDMNEFGMLWSYINDLQRQFNSLGTGWANYDQSKQLLGRNYSLLQQQGGDRVFQGLFNQVDVGRSGRLDWPQFLKLGLLLGTSLSLVEHFQFMQQPTQQFPQQQYGGYQQGLAPQQAPPYGQVLYQQTTTTTVKPGSAFDFDRLLNDMVPSWLGGRRF